MNKRRADDLPDESARIVENYLETLEAALAGVGPALRRGTIARARTRIDAALASVDHPATPEETHAILERIGTPAEIATEAIENPAATAGTKRRLAGGWVPPLYAVLALAGLFAGIVTPWLWPALGLAFVLLVISDRWTGLWKGLGTVALIVGGPVPALAADYGRFSSCETFTSPITTNSGDIIATSCTATVGGQLAVLIFLCLILASAIAIVTVAVHGVSAGRPGTHDADSRAAQTRARALDQEDSAMGADAAAPTRRGGRGIHRWLDAAWVPLAYGTLAVLGIVAGTFWPLWFCLAAGLAVIAISPRWIGRERFWGIAGPVVAALAIVLLNRDSTFNPSVPCTQSVTTTNPGDVFVIGSGCDNGLTTVELVVGYGLVMLVVIGIALTAYIAVLAARRSDEAAN